MSTPFNYINFADLVGVALSFTNGYDLANDLNF